MKTQNFLCQNILCLSPILNGITVTLLGDALKKHRDNECGRRKVRFLIIIGLDEVDGPWNICRKYYTKTLSVYKQSEDAHKFFLIHLKGSDLMFATQTM